MFYHNCSSQFLRLLPQKPELAAQHLSLCAHSVHATRTFSSTHQSSSPLLVQHRKNDNKYLWTGLCHCRKSKPAFRVTGGHTYSVPHYGTWDMFLHSSIHVFSICFIISADPFLPRNLYLTINFILSPTGKCSPRAILQRDKDLFKKRAF